MVILMLKLLVTGSVFGGVVEEDVLGGEEDGTAPLAAVLEGLVGIGAGEGRLDFVDRCYRYRLARAHSRLDLTKKIGVCALLCLSVN